jgi:IS605 OrfB family transposase
MKSNKKHTLAVYKVPRFQYSYNRDYSFTKDGHVSLATLNGRIKVPFVTTAMEQYFSGEWEFGTATLVYKKSKFFLHISIKKQIPVFDDSTIRNVVGVDFGINYLLTAIDSKDQMRFVSGKQVKNKKANFIRLRKELQHRGTTSAKRKLQQIAGKENRWQANLNHCLSKALIQFAGNNSLIVIEDLTGIHLSAPVARNNRYFHSSWAFAQLRQMIEYKAVINDIKVMAVNPKYTSQRCPKCGYTHQTNRNYSIHTFICQKCGYTSNDDRVGAINLRQVGIEYRSKLSR